MNPKRGFKGQVDRCSDLDHIPVHDPVPEALSLITKLEVHQLSLRCFTLFLRLFLRSFVNCISSAKLVQKFI